MNNTIKKKLYGSLIVVILAIVAIILFNWHETQPDLSKIKIYIGDGNYLSSTYLFSWDDIPGNDNVRLIEILKNRFYIEWAETATIEKIDGGKTIKVSTEKNSLSLKLNDEKTKVNMTINGIRATDAVFARMKNSKLDIYSSDTKILLLNYSLNLTTLKREDICNALSAYPGDSGIVIRGTIKNEYDKDYWIILAAAAYDSNENLLGLSLDSGPVCGIIARHVESNTTENFELHLKCYNTISKINLSGEINKFCPP